MAKSTTDLTQRPPRSARVRIGGYVILARMLDKGRATLAGKHGEYHYNCPMDQHFTKFAGIDAAALKKQLAAGRSDAQILEWITRNSKTKPSPVEIHAWSAFFEQRTPADIESRDYFNEVQKKAAPKREDVSTWFELLDLDDFASFGGNA